MREAGAACPHCAADVATGDPVVVCQACGTVHHEACWADAGRLRLVCLRPARRPEIAANATEPVLLITQAELGRAIPLRDAGLPHRAGPPGSRTRSPDATGRSHDRLNPGPAGWRSPR